MPSTKGVGEELAKLDQRRCRLMREAGGRVLRMADGDLLEILHAPEIAILADCAEIEARHAERLRADLRVPAIEAAEIEVRRAVRKTSGLDRIEVVDQEQEDVAVRRIEGRRVLGNVDAGIVDPGRPVEHAGHLPARVARAIAGDPLHGLNEFMVVDPAVVGLVTARSSTRPSSVSSVLICSARLEVRPYCRLMPASAAGSCRR